MSFEDGAWNILNMCVGPSYTEEKNTHPRAWLGPDNVVWKILQKQWLGLESPSMAVSSKADGRASNKKFSKPIIYIDMYCFPWLFQGHLWRLFEPMMASGKTLATSCSPWSSSKYVDFNTTATWSSRPPSWRFWPSLYVMNFFKTLKYNQGRTIKCRDTPQDGLPNT